MIFSQLYPTFLVDHSSNYCFISKHMMIFIPQVVPDYLQFAGSWAPRSSTLPRRVLMAEAPSDDVNSNPQNSHVIYQSNPTSLPNSQNQTHVISQDSNRLTITINPSQVEPLRLTNVEPIYANPYHLVNGIRQPVVYANVTGRPPLPNGTAGQHKRAQSASPRRVMMLNQHKFDSPQSVNSSPRRYGAIKSSEKRINNGGKASPKIMESPVTDSVIPKDKANDDMISSSISNQSSKMTESQRMLRDESEKENATKETDDTAPQKRVSDIVNPSSENTENPIKVAKEPVQGFTELKKQINRENETQKNKVDHGFRTTVGGTMPKKSVVEQASGRNKNIQSNASHTNQKNETKSRTGLKLDLVNGNSFKKSTQRSNVSKNEQSYQNGQSGRKRDTKPIKIDKRIPSRSVSKPTRKAKNESLSPSERKSAKAVNGSATTKSVGGGLNSQSNSGSTSDNGSPSSMTNSGEKVLETVLRTDTNSVRTYPSLSELNFSSLAAQKIMHGESINSIDTLVEVNRAATVKESPKEKKTPVTSVNFGYL